VSPPPTPFQAQTFEEFQSYCLALMREAGEGSAQDWDRMCDRLMKTLPPINVAKLAVFALGYAWRLQTGQAEEQEWLR
jgi:hypothetical protein